MRVARGIEARQVHTDGFGACDGIGLPFGGVEKSGHGREKGFAALRETSRLRTVILEHGR